MSIQIQLRRGSSTQWSAANPVLADGELVYDKDNHNLKIGNGASSYTQLPFLITGGGGGAVISAGSNSRSTGTVNFSNSNGIYFGMNTNGVVTASQVDVNAGAMSEIAITTASNTSVGGYVSIGSNTFNFYSNGNLSSAVMSGGTMSLVNSSANFIVADVSNSTFANLASESQIDYSRYFPYAEVYRGGNFPHVQMAPLLGQGEIEAAHHRTAAANRYGHESGLDSMSAPANIFGLNAGVVWAVNRRYSIPAVSHLSNTRLFKCYHTAGVWTVAAPTTDMTVNNTQYDDGTDLQTLPGGSYVAIYYFRGIEDQDHLYTVYSDQFVSVEAAKASGVIGNLPEIITSHAMLVGRIIVDQAGTVDPANIESVFTTTFSGSTPITNHNDLIGLQGGSSTNYYHVSPQIYSNLTGNSYLTTAAQSNHSHGFATTTTNGSQVVVATSNSNGVTLAVPPFITAGGAGNAVTQWQAGTVTQNGANNQIVFTGSNGISVHGNGSTISISLQDIHHLDGFIAQGNNNGTGFSSLTSGTLAMNFTGNISASQNGGGLTLSVPTQTVQTQNSVLINGNSGAFTLAGTNTGATNCSVTVNSSGVSVNVPANSTGYATSVLSTGLMPLSYSSGFQTATLSNTFARTADVATSVLSNTFAPRTNVVGVQSVSTVATAGSQMTGSAGSAGITLAVPAWVTAAAGGGNTLTISGSNGSLQTNGLTVLGSGVAQVYTTTGNQFVVSVPSGGGAGDGYNPAQFTNSTADSTQAIVWAGNSNGSGNVTMGLTGSTVTMSVPSGGGGATLDRWWNPMNALQSTTVNSIASGSASVIQMLLPVPVQFSRVDIPMNFSGATTTLSNVAAWIQSNIIVLYTRTGNTLNPVIGASNTQSWSWSSNSTASAWGNKLMSIPIQTTLPADEYWIGLYMSSNTASWIGAGATTALGMTVSVVNQSIATGHFFAEAGSTTNVSANGYMMGCISSRISATSQTLQVSQVSQTGANLGRAFVPMRFRNV